MIDEMEQELDEKYRAERAKRLAHVRETCQADVANGDMTQSDADDMIAVSCQT